MNIILWERLLPESDAITITKLEDGCKILASKNGGSLRLDTVADIKWEQYEYIQFDVYHESHDVMVILLTFEENSFLDNRKFIEVHIGTLPYVKTTVCVPLSVVNGEKLFLKRFPGMMQCVLRGDESINRRRISGVTISTIPSVSVREWTMSNLILSHEPIESKYIPDAYIDSMGQCKHKDWPGKIHSEEEMIASLRNELNTADISVKAGHWGWSELRLEATGFFRTHHDGSRWWLVDPDGYVLFSAGIDCISPNSETSYDQMSHLFPDELPQDGVFIDAVSERGYDFGIANLIKAFGSEWRESWSVITKQRLLSWGMNSIGNWSDPGFIHYSEMPFVYPMDNYPTTEELVYRDFPDVFHESYEQRALEFAKQLSAFKDNRLMMGYFMRNEPHWAFVDELCLSVMLLKNPSPLISKQYLIDWLEQKYDSIHSLNEAWATSYKTFAQLMVNPPPVLEENPIILEDLRGFDRILIRRYVELPAKACREAAPNHLNMGMRYAFISRPELLEGCEYFDVFSLNAYQMKPDEELVRMVADKLNMPIIIGEFHFGGADVGMLATGIRALSTQEERGLAYRYYLEQAAANPNIVGVHYFQWNDQPVLGRFDGENYQIGMLDVCQQPYLSFINEMKKAHDNMYAVRSGSLEPFSDPPREIPKTGF
ncbi:beta-galactosidase [Paenibacillus antarcticus]|uniref:Glycoside hydrolase family 42 N-terminal domain-containing protein n=1 Tax=Paenibacillus antarcticus TaxID=253703 RepID=A0A168MMU5_9BACL|nr:beta-galactosidase [Paenibacillus antarcticus]OAB44856.1 hypothetical protein PBAT_14840 [Paenibacillus antarcticus]